MIFDLHVHTKYSEDGIGSPKEFAKKVLKIGISGFAITDHNTTRGWREAREIREVIVIPGIEVSTSRGHLIGLGIFEEIPRGKSPEETAEIISELGGVVVIPHPLRFFSGLKLEEIRKISGKAEAIEVFNARSSRRKNYKARKIAEELKLPGTGGSDAHSPEYLGYGLTRVEGEFETYEEVLEEIRRGNSEGFGREIPLSGILRMSSHNLKLWLRRGMRRI